MASFFERLFASKPSLATESDDNRRRRIDQLALDLALSVQTCLRELQGAPTLSDKTHVLALEAGLIYRLQQDVFRVHGVNLARPEPFLRTSEGIAVYNKAFETVENLHRELQQVWKAENSRGDIDGTALAGLSVFACRFWMTSLFAPSSTVPLQLCVQNNHLTIAAVSKADVIALARRHINAFLPTGNYAFEEAHWPYVELDQVLKEYREATKEGSLADQFLRAIREG